MVIGPRHRKQVARELLAQAEHDADAAVIAIFVGDGIRADRFADNWDKTFSAPQDNSVTVKIIYWLDAGRMLSGKHAATT